jgi:hypothetical protein
MRPDTNDLSECYYATYRAILSIIHNISPAPPPTLRGEMQANCAENQSIFFLLLEKATYDKYNIFLHYSGGQTEANYMLEHKKSTAKLETIVFVCVIWQKSLCWPLPLQCCTFVGFFLDGWIKITTACPHQPWCGPCLSCTPREAPACLCREGFLFLPCNN